MGLKFNTSCVSSVKRFKIRIYLHINKNALNTWGLY